MSPEKKYTEEEWAQDMCAHEYTVDEEPTKNNKMKLSKKEVRTLTEVYVESLTVEPDFLEGVSERGQRICLGNFEYEFERPGHIIGSHEVFDYDTDEVLGKLQTTLSFTPTS